MATTKETLLDYIREGTPTAIIERYYALDTIKDDTDFGLLDNNVVVVDTEATGLSYKSDELIQIAAAKINNGQIEDWYITFVNPGIEISEEITHLTHISNDDVVDAPQPGEALKGLVEFCGNAIMVAHNVSFDKTFLTKHPEGYLLLDNIWVDSLDLARIAFPRLTSHRLIDLSRAFGIIESTHRADDDVATTCILYRLCLAAISQMPIDLINIIANLASVDMWPTSYIFKQMLQILPKLDTHDCVIDDLEQELSINNDYDLFGEKKEKFNSVGILRSMRNERFTELPKQKKYDVEMDEPKLYPANTDNEIIAQDSMQFPCENDLKDEFSNSGILGKIYSDYEQRDEQIQMATKVLDAFINSCNLAIEAGTGVGKSMAYLIPAIKIAKQNQITIGVATKTNSLLDQLIYHELPALSNHIDGLIYSSIKGAKHYICLRKVSYLANSKAKMINYKEEWFCNAPSVAGLLSYIEQTAYDDCDGIKINNRALSNLAYTCASHECLHNKCPFFYNGCFVHGARRMAKNSDIVVTNHTMLFCDLKANNGLLPPIRYWIIDEAHGIEKEARRSFSSNILAQELLEIATSLGSENPKLNVFERIARNIDISEMESKSESNLSFNQEQEGKSIVYGLINKCKSCGKKLSLKSNLFANNICLLLDFAQKTTNGYEFVNLWINNDICESEQFNKLYKYAKEWYDSAENLLTNVSKLLTYLNDYKSLEIIIREISAFAFNVKEILNSCDVIFFNNNDKYVYSANINNKKTIKFDKLVAEPYSVSQQLNDNFYSQCKSIVFTSATLALANSFESFKTSVGLNSKTLNYQLSSSFNYDKNMTIYIAKDMPDPNSAQYLDTLGNFLSSLHNVGNGSILSLFTNRRQMEKCHEHVCEHICNNNLRILIQKWGLSVKGVKDEFLNDEKLSLFALKNFWEGFDAPGATLKGVVITKLPFTPATDPLNKERSERESNSWYKYTLPDSIIETKQAVGRLIRKAGDSGYVVFTDSRLETKSYGTIFKESMPSKSIKIMTMDEIINDVKNLFL